MLRFKQWLNNQDKIPAVILNPNYDEIKRKLIEKEKKLQIKESRESFKYGYDTTPEEQRLKSHYNDFTPAELDNINHYSDQSFHLNGHLLAAHHLNIDPEKQLSFRNDKSTYNLDVMDHLLSRKPIGKKTVLFHGASFDPRTKMNKNGLIHLPAYTSTSISPNSAKIFADESDATEKHVIRIQAHPHDTGAYVGTRREREFILPRNTTLRIHRSERSKEDPNYWIHHATIEHDIDPKDIQRDPNVVYGLGQHFHRAFETQPTNKAINDKISSTLPLHINNPNSTAAHALLTRKNIFEKNLDQPTIDTIAAHENSTEAHENLASSHYAGKDIGPDAIKVIANNPKSTSAHRTLASAHYAGKDIGPDAIKAIANNPKSNHAHMEIAVAKKVGNPVDENIINTIVDHGSPSVHATLAGAHYSGNDIGQHAINSIANNPHSTEAHAELAKVHAAGKMLGKDEDDKDAINAIANNPESTDAHTRLAKAHQDGKDIGTDAINAIANHKNSTDAQYWLARAHGEGKNIGTDAINAIANHKNSTAAHNWLARAHAGGKYPIGDHALQKLRSYGHNI